MKKVFKLDFDGRQLVVETGELAKQTNGAVLVRYGDTAVLSVCVMGKTPVSQDFFPLQVLYQERLYSVGKIPGGFIKREGRPSDAATLAARLIDRPIRPMFDENLRNEIQVINTVLSVDQDNSPEMTALFGSSLCLGISNIPFDGPVAGVIVGLVDGKFVINPTAEQNEISELHLTVAGTKDAICMVEAGSKEVSEELMLDALMFAHENIKKLCEFEQSIIDEIGVEKVELPKAEIDSEIEKSVRDFATADMLAAIQIKDKLEKYAKIDEVKENTMAHFDEVYAEDEDKNNKMAQVSKVLHLIEGGEVKKENNYESSKITTLIRNTVLKVLEIEDDWCKIFYGGQYGWIKTENLASIYSNPNYNINQENKNIIYSFDMELNKPSGLTLEQFQKILTDDKDINSIFRDNAEYFYYIEKEYNINGVFVAAIGIHESAWGKSNIAKNKKNLFGYRAYDSDPYNSASTFNTYAEGIDLIARVLTKYYLNPKGTEIYNGETAVGTYYNGSTVTAVNKKYASDSGWANKVYSYMEYLYKKI